jgi:cell division protein FtsL
MKFLKFFKSKPQWLQSMQENWFPADPISLKSVLRETFWVETSKPVVRLVVAIFISALFLVLIKNAYHQAFMKLQTLKLEQDNLHTEWMQLLIEEGTWGNYDRVYQIATTQMNMGPPTPFATQILVVKDPPDSHLVRLANASLLSHSLFDRNGYFPATLDASQVSTS